MDDINDIEQPTKTEPGESKPSYRLTLEGDGITLSRDVSQETALALINVALGGAPNAPLASGQHPGSSKASITTATSAGATTRSTTDTPGEFLETVGARTNVDKIVALGAFLHDQRDQDQFSRDDVKGMFRAAHESAPANFPRDFKAALTARALGEDGPGRYFVTRTGRALLERGFTASEKGKTPERELDRG